ncbi:MAG TPA: glycosyl hydrolase family 28-related protein [Anaerolineae bacterium]|nr:glycosyl hydrolase family 28-related protein [Anaerolineae bacterium]HQI87156.1 glycosyl hydrolase family 28-related protein [Anaerolineae bacterium]
MKTATRFTGSILLLLLAACTASAVPPITEVSSTATPSTLPPPVLTSEDGLAVFNGGFEAGNDANADFWSEGAAHSRSAERAHEGQWALKSAFSGDGGTDTRTDPLPVKRATYYQLSGWIYKANLDGYAYLDMNDIEEELALVVGPGSGGQWMYLEGLWYSGERTAVQLRCVTDNGVSGDVWFDEIRLTEVKDMAQPRKSRIVEPIYPVDDVVVIDYAALDYTADPTGSRDATQAIQQALNDCHHNGGGTVWLPVGTYKVTRTIFVWPFCTLRGDWRDPDSAPGDSYGTVIQADVAPGSEPLFLIGGSAAALGLTVYYPHQNAAQPVEYGWTFEIRGNGWSGNANYHASSVINCTLLNAYKGIGLNAPPYETAVHELSRVRNVKGTALYQGLDARNCADVGTWRDITFSNAYWANAPAAYQPPDRAILDAWTHANGTAFTFADLEWDNFYRLAASDYNVGIRLVDGKRIAFAGQILYANIHNTNVALKAEDDSIDYRVAAWGMSFLRSTLEGSDLAVETHTAGRIHITDSTLTGTVYSQYGERVYFANPGDSLAAYPEAVIPRITRAVLYDVTQAPYFAPFVAPNTEGLLPAADATRVIQQALDDAGADGGGAVYLPAGWYNIAGHLTVPANVELRGAASTPQRSQDGLSNGTVLFASEGEGTSTPEKDAALITLNGDRAGVRGLRVFYPHNDYADGAGKVYPYAVRVNGDDAYVVDIVIENGYLGVDVAAGSDRHALISVFGATTEDFIAIGATVGGRVEDCHSNPNFWMRNGYGITFWDKEAKQLFADRRQNVTFIRINGATDEALLNNFIYAAQYGVHIVAGSADIFNIGTDNLGKEGYTVLAEDGATVRVHNSMRYNGKANTSGAARSYNELHL